MTTKPSFNMELPILNVPGEIDKINFLMQCGLIRDKVSIDIVDLNLKSLKDTACNFIDRNFQDHGKNKLAERLLLFKHDYSSPSMLTTINVASEITDGSLVEIVLSLNEPSDEIQIRPHYLQVHSFKTPTFCDFCGELLFGLTRQGLKCDCSLVCHKRCAYKLPNDCPSAFFRRRRSSTHLMPSTSNEQITRTASSGATFTDTLSSLLPTSPNHQRRGSSSSEKGFFSSFTNHSSSGIGGSNSSQATTPTSAGPNLSAFLSADKSQLNIITGRPFWVEKELAGRIRVPHTFLVHSYKKPTLCQYCKKLLKGFFRQGKQCKDCKYNVHKKCADKVPMTCTGEAPKEWTAENELLLSVTGNGDGKSESGSEMADSLIVSKDEDSDGESENSGEANELTDEHAKTPDDQLSVKLSEHSKNNKLLTDDEETSELIDIDSQKLNQVSDTSANNIPLMRLVQSFKHTKGRTGKDYKVIKEGWMIHFTNRDSMKRSTRKRHFWRLDSKAITLFQHDSSPNFYKEILISEILAINSPVTYESYGFELLTKNLSYFCGEFNNSDTKDWEIAIRKLYMPTLNEKELILNKPPDKNEMTMSVKMEQNRKQTNQSAVLQEIQLHSQKQTQQQQQTKNERVLDDKIITMTNAGSKENENLNNQQSDFDISLQYQIFPDEILGSGQFGIVYLGIHRTSGRSVAIKVIDKLRFPTKQEAQLKNEVSILQNIHHPGVVNLEKMFETKERIFVVMEKLHGDMLELILSSEKQRLTERCTRCLIYQILIALKYLHSKSIVHCDLKPENVLLSSDSDFPVVKLCDFGFARIIGEKSFRRSLVGTPAYLAPEVLRNKCYNRLLDMWSVGVIIYVSLSGTFPFNEDEDINDQIQNAAFMYPPNPWSEVSENGIDLIKNLLQVKAKKRYTVDRSLWHPWLENYETWCDLRELEIQHGQRWMTLEVDDERWTVYAREHRLPLPNFKSSPDNNRTDEQKSMFKINKDYRMSGRSGEPLSTIKDEKSNSTTETNDVIEEHPEP